MWKSVLRPHNSQERNIKMDFPCSVCYDLVISVFSSQKTDLDPAYSCPRRIQKNPISQLLINKVENTRGCGVCPYILGRRWILRSNLQKFKVLLQYITVDPEMRASENRIGSV
jgi:hypothetical protein